MLLPVILALHAAAAVLLPPLVRVLGARAFLVASLPPRCPRRGSWPSPPGSSREGPPSHRFPGYPPSTSPSTSASTPSPWPWCCW
ncbi:hypothetical protein ACFQXA_14400 [Nocardiopsis composta]